MIKRIFKWFLVIIFMTVIFMFSNDAAAQSQEKSRFLINILNLLGINVESTFGSLAEFVIRKAAHFTEYFVLYLLLFNALYNDISKKTAIYAALALTFAYACTDEFHQLFIPGREGKFRDVLIDTAGGGLGLFILKILVPHEKSLVSDKKDLKK